MSEPDMVNRRIPTFLFLIFMILATGLLFIGYLSYREFKQRYISKTEDELTAITELKVQELMHWRQDRIADAAILISNPSIIDLATRLLDNPDDIRVRVQIENELQGFLIHHRYERIMLLDTQCVKRWILPDGPERPVSSVSPDTIAHLANGEPVFEDFYWNDAHHKVYLKILIPIRTRSPTATLRGFLALRIDPSYYLYPFLSTWPTASRTAETLMVRRDQDQVLFLNPLRFNPDAALHLRFPLDRSDLPASQVIKGAKGMVSGRDYRGVQVLACVQPVPDSPWLLVSRIDQEEAFAPIQQRLWTIIGFVALLFTGTATSLGLVWRHYHMAHYQSQLNTLKSLYEISERQKSLLAAVPDIIMEVNNRKIYTWANAAGLEFFGPDVLGREAASYFVGEPDTYQRVEPLFNGNENVMYVESWQRRQDGESRLLAWWCRVIKDPDGRPIGGISSARDITDQRKNETAIHFQAEILNQVENLVTVTDLEGRILYVNDAECRFMKCTRESLIGHPVTIYGEDTSRGASQTDIIKHTVELGSWRCDVVNFTPDGTEVTLDCRTRLMYDAKGRPFALCGIATDITQRKQAEQQRLQMEQKLQLTQKFESLGVLAGGIAHDFNNILMAVMGHAELALDALSPMSVAREDIREIEVAARRAAELCRQMLTYAGKSTLTREPVDLLDLMEEMAHLLKTSISKKALLNLHLERGLPPIAADPSQIRQVVMNLIVNASEAIGDRSGVINLSLGAIECDADYLSRNELNAEMKPGFYVFIEVSDTGVGMDAATRARIFEPFFTTKFAGRGLGLAAVLGIIRAHQAILRVYSEPDKGSTFKVLFPVMNTPPLNGAIEKPDATNTSWKAHGSILLVDDEETLRALGSRILSTMGFTVHTAVDGMDALRIYREHSGNIDLVLLDMTMPHMDGIETSRQLRQLDEKIKIVVTSGYSSEEVSGRFSGKGLTGVLQKPFTRAKLQELLAGIFPA